MENSDDSFTADVLDRSFIEINHEETVPSDNLDNLTCGICGNISKSNSSLKRHMKRHDDSAFACTQCSQYFGSEEELTDHQVKKHHPRLCVHCGKTFSSKFSLDRHIMARHGVGSPTKTLKCLYPECSKAFTTKSSFETHQNIHQQIKPFACVKCDHVFSLKYEKNRHEKVCTGLVRLSCQVCGMVFTRRQSLDNHIEEQHEVKRHMCCCGKSFAYASSLSKHRRKCTIAPV